MIDERTSRLNLALPVNSNTLKDDCERLRETFTTLDGVVATIGLDGKLTAEQIPSNVPTLGGDGKLAASTLPAIAITDTFTAASQAAMLALNAQTGDVAVRSDLNKTFILMAEPATTLSNWVELLNDALVQLAKPDGYLKIGGLNTSTLKATYNVRGWGAKGDGATDDTAAIKAAIADIKAKGGGTLYFPAGIYLISSVLDLTLTPIRLLGDGFNQTFIKASAAMSVMIDNWQATMDWGWNEFSMHGIQFDGNNLADVVYRVQWRNYVIHEHCAFFGGKQYDVQAQSNISNSWYACAFGNSPVPLALLGSNHRNSFRSCTIVGATNTFLQIIDGSDGNSALQFDNCDIEYQNGTDAVTGIYARVKGTVSFNDCYIGEGINGTCFHLEGTGALNIKGGFVVTGVSPTGALTRVDGSGQINFSDVECNGDANANVSLLGSNWGTNLVFERSRLNFATLGIQKLYGNGLGRRSAPQIVPAYGRAWNVNANGGTVQHDYSGTDHKVTVFATSSMMSMYSAIDASRLSVGLGSSGRYSRVIVTYQSDVAVSARFTSSNLGSPVTDLGQLPASPNGFVTAIIPCDISSAATILEFDFPGTVTGTKFTLRDCTILDAAQCTNAEGVLTSLYKAM